MNFKIKISVIKDRDWYIASSSDLPGLVVEGESQEEVKEKFREAAEGYVSSYELHYESLPVD